MTVRRLTAARISESDVAAIDADVSVEMVDKPSSLGRGTMESHAIGDGLRVMRADVYGVPKYKAIVTGLSGFVIEVRLSGISQSREIAGSRVGDLASGNIGVVGNSKAATWDVRAPAQASFRTVSVGYSREWLAAHRSRDPECVDAASAIIDEQGRADIETSPRCSAIAEELLHLDFQQPGAALDAEALALRLFAQVMRLIVRDTDDRPPPEKLVRTIVARIEDSPRPDMTIKELADSFGVSESTLKRKFIDQLGVTPGAYARQIRMRKARDLLLGGLDIETVASLSGYSTPVAFSRAFKKQFACLPKSVAKHQAV